MQQPKYKFGDKVVSAEGEVFTIHRVEHVGETFYYHNQGTPYPQFALRLYQEPRPKKLYAYTRIEDNGAVNFFRSEPIGGKWKYERLPEYDITYKEST